MHLIRICTCASTSSSFRYFTKFSYNLSNYLQQKSNQEQQRKNRTTEGGNDCECDLNEFWLSDILLHRRNSGWMFKEISCVYRQRLTGYKVARMMATSASYKRIRTWLWYFLHCVDLLFLPVRLLGLRWSLKEEARLLHAFRIKMLLVMLCNAEVDETKADQLFRFVLSSLSHPHSFHHCFYIVVRCKPTTTIWRRGKSSWNPPSQILLL